MQKIVTSSAIKGGVGKTTLLFNFGEWLAAHDKNVLFIDLDHQGDLSHTYNIYDSDETVGNIFLQQGKVKIHELHKNVSLISAHVYLDEIEKSIETQTNKNMLLYMWFSQNFNYLNLSTFDYILIDCHPAFSTITKNAFIVSHAILSPLTPDQFGYDAKKGLETRYEALEKEAIEFSTGKSYLTANLLYIANKIKPNTNSSHQLLASVKDDPSVVATIPDRELFNRSTMEQKPISTMEKDHKTYIKYRKFFDELNKTFTHIANSI